MEFGFLSQAAKFLQDRKNDKRWRTVFLCLAATVAFGTVTALKLYGQAMTHKVKVLDCQYAVHEHTDDCYEKDENGDPTGGPVCGYADYVIHVHNDDCYREGELVCGLEEHELHEHDDSCYEETDVLVCEESESESVSGHQHTDACYTEVQGELTCEESTEGGHIHDDSCYSSELVCDLEEHSHGDGCYSSELACDDESEEHEHGDGCYSEELTCGQEEHSHGDSCYSEELTCGQEESTAHEHTDDCYGTKKELTCTQGESESVEGHTHDDSCYETEETLTCGELELHTHVEALVEDGGCYDESAFDGETGEFIEGSRPVCGIPQLEEHVHTEDCFQTVELTADEIAALNGGASLHIHTDDCYDEEGNLICGYDVTHIHNLECYDEQGNLICGFGAEEEETSQEIRLEADAGNYTIVLEAPREAFPDAEGELVLEAVRFEEESEEYQTARELLEKTIEPAASELPFEIRIDGEDVTESLHGVGSSVEEPELADAQNEASDPSEETASSREETETDGVSDIFDIRVMEGDTELQPAVPVRVYFIRKDARSAADGEAVQTPEDAGEKIQIFHVDTEKELVENMNATKDTDGNVVIATPHFSAFAVQVGEQTSDPLTWKALVDGVSDASAGAEITIGLNSDVTFTGEELALDNKKLTLDLKGHSITYSSAAPGGAGKMISVGEGATLTITNSEGPQADAAYLGIGKETLSPGSIRSDEAAGLGTLIHVTKNGKLVIDNAFLCNAGGNTVRSENVSPFSYQLLFEYKSGYIEGKDKWDDLVHLFNNGGGHSETLKLADDLVFNGTSVYFDRGRHLNLDLNGHKITYPEGKEEPLFIVGGTDETESGSLTICDSAAGDVRQISAESVSAGVGYESSYSDGRLIYYLTRSTGTHEDGSALERSEKIIRTAETTTRYEYDLTAAGALENSQSGAVSGLIKVLKNGTVHIEGGRLTNASGPAITTAAYSNDPVPANMTVDLTGGYLVGSCGTKGGAVNFEGIGTLNISGNIVIAANTAETGGGIRTKGKDGEDTVTLNVSGGYICGNTASGSGDDSGFGGGLRIQDTWLNLEKGFITNNKANTGGGGICSVWSSLVMTGGLIADNDAGTGGGGIWFSGDTRTVRLSGGAVAGNEAAVEGGGIRLNTGYAEIAAEEGKLFYITNNTGNKNRQDWGGGGIFISDNNGRMKIYKTLITGNTAKGFGGGLGGCSTGRLISLDVANGAAVYGNSADGSVTAGEYSSKHQDREAMNSPVFMADQGYQDVFSALGCAISQGMLSGVSAAKEAEPARWKGSCDYVPVSYNDQTGEPWQIESSRMLGLTADPTEEGKRKAEEIADVFITGNSSTTHGGGIMCNGLLLLGDSQEAHYDEALTLYLRKEYRNDKEDGKRPGLDQGDFQFQLLDENGSVLSTVSNSMGNNPSETNVRFLLNYRCDSIGSGDGTSAEYTYYLKEVIPQNQESVIYDPSVYRIKVKVVKRSDSYTVGSNVTISREWIYIESVSAEKQTEVDGWESVAVTDQDGLGDYQASTSHHGCSVVLGGKTDNVRDPLFTNMIKTPPLTFWIHKTDGLTGEIMKNVWFTLTRLGEDGKKLADTEGASNVKSGNTENTGELSFTIPDAPGSYVLEETVPKGYEEAGPWYVEVTADSNGDEKGEVLIYQAEEAEDGSYRKTGQPLTSAQTVKDGISYPLFCIENVPFQYELPETGGMGGDSYYTGAGAALMLLVTGFCAYSFRRKTRERRSKETDLR